jgi:translation initiation factor IF-2
VPEPAPVAEVEAVSEPAPLAEAVPEPAPEPVAEPEAEPAVPEPAVEPEVAPAEAAAIPSPHAHPLSPEPATAGHMSWETPQSNSVPATSASGGSRPELVLAAGFVGGLLLAQVVKRIAK